MFFLIIIMNAILKFYTLAADIDMYPNRIVVVKQALNPRIEIKLNYKRRNGQF